MDYSYNNNLKVSEDKLIQKFNAQIVDFKEKLVDKKQENLVVSKDYLELLENVSSLLQTTTAELKRKDAMIADIRRQTDNRVFRRDDRHVRNHEFRQPRAIDQMDQRNQRNNSIPWHRQLQREKEAEARRAMVTAPDEVDRSKVWFRSPVRVKGEEDEAFYNKCARIPKNLEELNRYVKERFRIHVESLPKTPLLNTNVRQTHLELLDNVQKDPPAMPPLSLVQSSLYSPISDDDSPLLNGNMQTEGVTSTIVNEKKRSHKKVTAMDSKYKKTFSTKHSKSKHRTESTNPYINPKEALKCLFGDTDDENSVNGSRMAAQKRRRNSSGQDDLKHKKQKKTK